MLIQKKTLLEIIEYYHYIKKLSESKDEKKNDKTNTRIYQKMLNIYEEEFKKKIIKLI